MQLTDRIERAAQTEFARLLTGGGDGPVGMAVSGGGDSMALLVLAADWASAEGRDLRAVSVDHGLRPEAVEEIALVEDICAIYGIPHSTLRWTGWDGTGNLQDRARQARHDLIREWADVNDVCAVATGHTLDDQAETFLMRLARGSGVDGLSAMYDAEVFEGLRWVRPLLRSRRADLRDYLKSRNVVWAEDPTNEDPGFDRVKFRQAAGALAELGLDAPTLAATADRMQVARQALEQATHDLAAQIAQPTDIGTVRIDRVGLLAAPPELQLRLLAHAIGWVSRQGYRTRLEPLRLALAAISDNRNATLGGCIVAVEKKAGVEVCREPKAVPESQDASALFDGRWRIEADLASGNRLLRALGEEGLAQCPGWRDSGYSRRALMASPSLWQNGELLAAPFVFKTPACEVSLAPQLNSFLTTIMKH
jgi:tRNA(Ile)-lysidine synthase